MMAEVLFLIMSVIGRCHSYFERLLVSAGGFGPYIAAFFLFQVGRFLISPIFGTAAGVFLGSMGSDAARHGYGRDHSPNQKKLPGGKS